MVKGYFALVHRVVAMTFQVGAITSTAVAIATALLAFLFLRRPTGEAERHAQLPCEPAGAHA
jgi:hypothetical protein